MLSLWTICIFCFSDCRSSSAFHRAQCGHSIENVRHDPCHVLICFNTGIYQTIDRSQWIAGNPTEGADTNFSKPASLFEKFPRKDVFVTPLRFSNPCR